LNKLNQLKHSDIQTSVGTATYGRGKRYYEQGRVLTLKTENVNDTVLIKSTVQDDGGLVYEQKITIDHTQAHIDVSGVCDCPVRYDCKHVAATCLRYYHEFIKPEEASKISEKACIDWLDSLLQPDEPSTVTSDIITFVLQPGRSSGKLQVNFFATRQLKKRGLGKGRRINLNLLVDSHNNASFIQATDRDIAKLLQVNSRYNWYEVLIQGELGYLALTKMIETGRCYWNNLEHAPLRFSDARKLDTDWQYDDQGNARLNISIQPQGSLLITEPLLYLDSTTRSVGLLTNNTYSMQQIEKLLHAPAIPARIINQFSLQLVNTPALSDLPPLKTVDIKKIEQVSPIPCLTLFQEKNADHCIRLRFAYGDIQLPYYPANEVSNITLNNEVIYISRLHKQEDNAIETLKNSGFTRHADKNNKDLIFLSNTTDNPMEGINRWHQFLSETIPQLEKKGWKIEFDSSFQMNFHATPDWAIEVEEEGNDWFNLRFDVEIDNQSVSLLPLITQVLNHYSEGELPETLSFDLGNNQYLNIPSQQIKPILDTLYELYNSSKLSPEGALRLSRFDADRLEELDNQSVTNLQWRGGEALRQLGKKLKNFNGIETAVPPKALQATLRDYQQQGLNWLQFLRAYHFGGILADDMGLGKTLQTLAHLCLEKEQGRLNKPCLIIAPTSLMSNWRHEAKQFTPNLSVLILQGPERHTKFPLIKDNDIILSTYPLMVRDEEALLAHEYHSLILDEAQTIKNPRAKAAQVLRRVNAQHRLCLTGTPMENHLGELWALFDFAMPGFLGDTRQFKTLFRTPIEVHGDGERQTILQNRITPFMLRRTKNEVLQELPDKTEIIRMVRLEKKQAALYESIRLAMEQKVRQAIASKGLSRSHITILDALLKLRQTCCDPRLLPLSHAQSVGESAKLDLLMEMLPEMVEEGRRILLFSQFTKMLALIETELKKRNINYAKLTGQTRNRDTAIEHFKSGGAPIFLISLKAGGVGLNLTEADTVIHYDPWWNPAAENQGTDRAHRIGQKKAVFVYKLVTENSVEEKIVAMQARKKALADGVYSKKGKSEELRLTNNDLQTLFSPLE